MRHTSPLRLVRYMSSHNGKRVRAYAIYFGADLWDATISTDHVRALIADERARREEQHDDSTTAHR